MNIDLYFQMTKFTLFILAILCAQLSYAQLDNITLSAEQSNNTATINFGPFDNDELIQNELTKRSNGESPKFAIPVNVNITTKTHGQWENINGFDVWRLKVVSPGARSLNFGFSKFHLPENAVLRFYEDQTLSAQRNFTSKDNEGHNQLWTPCYKSDEVVIELIIPEDKTGLEFELSHVNHDFAGFLNPAGGSGSCNVDVMCSVEEGFPMIEAYRDATRSVGLLSLNGVGFCSGFLINNTANDCTPYFMTAKHCGINSGNAASVVVYWNYENSFCRAVGSAQSGAAGNGTQNIFNSGAIWRSTFNPSDMTLIEFDDPIAEEADAFFAGWNRANVTPTRGVAVHHPNGQEKRISFENNSLQLTSYLSTNVNSNADHLRVVDWDLGTTEGGSSGSPLFDENQRVVGQLHGGSAACGNDLSDWYGRFYTSWNGGQSASSRLRDWLDPMNTGQLTMDGTPANGCYIPLVLNLLSDDINVCVNQAPAFSIEMENNDINDFNITFDGLPLGVVANVVSSPLSQNSLIDVELNGFQNPGEFVIVMHVENEFQSSQISVPVTITGMPTATQLELPINGQTELPLSYSLNWLEINPSDTYKVEIATDVNFNNVIIQTFVTNNLYTATLPDPSTLYFWRVETLGECGTSPSSAVRSFTTVSSSNLSIPNSVQTICANGQINLALQIANDFSINPLSLSISNLPSGATFTTNIDSITSGDLVDILLDFQNAPTDLYNLSVVISDGVLVDSVYASVIVQSLPDNPSLLFPVNDENGVTLTDLSLEWLEMDDALNYQVLVSTSEEFETTVIDETTDFPFYESDLVLQSNRAYFWKIVANNSCGQSESSIRKFTTTTATSVDETQLISMEVFPNPASSKLHVEIDKDVELDEVSLFTITGQKLTENLKGAYFQTFDISNYPSGTYLLRVTSNGAVYTERVIIQH